MRATFYVYVKEDEQIKREIECDSYYTYRGMLLEREGKFSLVHHETTFTDELLMNVLKSSPIAYVGAKIPAAHVLCCYRVNVNPCNNTPREIFYIVLELVFFRLSISITPNTHGLNTSPNDACSSS